MEIYVVKPGDTVDTIASAYNVPVESLIYNNQLFSPYPLAVGQALLVPSETAPPIRSIQTFGYAYPYIEKDILDETLPFLSALPVFSYGFTAGGKLIAPNQDDTFMIEAAKEQGTAPVLVLAPIGEDGGFNTFLIHNLLQDEQALRMLLADLEETIQQKGFQGLNLDFEYILPQDREPYVSFVARVRSSLNPMGIPVSVALAPKVSSDQQGILYEGMDYAGLGEAADHVILMTYEWGYTFGPPMAVAPINEVRRVVEYAVSQIPHEKIFLGIPNYGYDWPLPYQPGTTRASAISLQRSVELAVKNDVPIQFDQISMSPHFSYRLDNTDHTVWFEDVRSLQEKFELIAEYDLAGASYWQIMTLFLPNWILLSDNFLIDRPYSL